MWIVYNIVWKITGLALLRHISKTSSRYSIGLTRQRARVKDWAWAFPCDSGRAGPHMENRAGVGLGRGCQYTLLDITKRRINRNCLVPVYAFLGPVAKCSKINYLRFDSQWEITFQQSLQLVSIWVHFRILPTENSVLVYLQGFTYNRRLS